MKKPGKSLKDFHLSYDIMIMVLGILLVVFLVLTFLHPENRFFMIAAFAAGGMVNIINGLKILKDKTKKNMGISYIFFGIIIMLLGILFRA